MPAITAGGQRAEAWAEGCHQSALKTQRLVNPATSRWGGLIEAGVQNKGMFSTTFRYALISLLELADSDALLQANTLASRYRLSPHYLAVVLADLRRLGLVQSHKGKNGGYRLACEPCQVNLLHLYHSLAGGQSEISQGLEITNGHHNPETLPKADRWLQELIDRWTAELATTTLADLQGLAEEHAN